MFRAEHIGGPLDGEQVSLTAPRVPELLYYASAPPGMSAITSSGHILVGYDTLDAYWPGVSEYQLDRASSDLRPHPEYEGMELGTAVYVLVDS